MKRILLLLFLLTTTFGFTQVGVNTTNPDPSSMLDISATNKGVLVPRVSLPNVTTTMLDGTNTAATGLLIWNTNAAAVGGNGVGFYFFNGALWIPLTQAVAGNTLDQSYDQGGAGVGKNINATDGSVRINGDDGFLVTGTFGTGNTIDTEITGAGTRMFFNPRKAAFRAGQADATEWNNSNIGNYSIALGRSNTALNDYDVAIGVGSTASGSYSTALGWANTASGAYSFSMGQNSTASGFQSTVLGLLSTATHDNAMVFGNNSVASANSSFALGNFSIASGLNSIAFGNNLTSKSGYESVFGIYNTDYTPVSVGGFNTADRLFVIGNGTNATNLSNALTIYKDGRMNINDAYTLPTTDGTNGQVMQTNGAGVVTWANAATATDDQQIDVLSLTGDTLNISLQDDGVATQTVNLTSLKNTLDQSYDQGGAGVGRTITADAGAVTINGTDGLVTTGTFGSGVVAPSGAGTKMFFNPRRAAFRAGNINGTQWDDVNIGNYSMALGQNVIASGNGSVAFGGSNTASGLNSAAFGSVSSATSDAAFVGGLFNTASGLASTAFGYRSVASGGASTALGNDNYARSYGETVIGIGATDYTPLNTVSAHPSGATDRLFVVGNAIDSNLSFSIDPSERSNALVILKNGETGLGANPTTGNRLTVGGKTATTNFQMTSGAAASYILQSDATGNATWVNPSVVDNQQIDVFSLTGTTLNLSLEDDGMATQTVNLSSLAGDDDWTDVGADIERQTGNVFIGDTNLTNNNLFISNQIIDWDNPSYSINPDGDSFMSEIQFDSGTVSDPSIRFSDADTGFFSPAASTTAYSSDGLEAFRIQPDGNISVGTTANSNYKLRVESPFDKTAYIGGTTATNGVMALVNNGTNGDGLNISLTSPSTTNSRTGIYSFNLMGNSIVEVSKFESTTNNVYGIKSYLLDVPFGTAYGIYSQAQDPTSFAGYFLGRTSIGTSAANNYILPLSRGTNGQTMQTDAAGNVTWVNPVVDTDDQAADVFSLTGTTLNLSLQNDGVPTQTVNLAALDTDNQQIDVLSLTGDTLNISLQDDGAATQTLNLAAIDNQATDVFSLTGNILNLSLQNDGVPTQLVDLSSLKDADWYEVGGANSPNAITDNKFTLGDISIGKITAATAKVDIDAASKLNTLYLLNTNANPGVKMGINNQLAADDTNDTSLGILNGLSGNANFKTAIQNNLTGNYTVGINSEYAINNILQSTGNISTYGLNNMFSASSATSGGFYGVNNQINGNNHDGLFYGLRNITSNTTTSDQYGVYNNFTGGGSGTRFGVNNFYNGFMSGDVLGVNTFILGSGPGTKYGERIQITENSGGVHYGIYADVIKSNSYAGYFLGRVSVGTTIANNYILPASRGTNGQIMQTDGAGNVSWSNAPTTTDADWYEVGGTNPAGSILDNIYTGGDVSIGKATAATGKVDIEADNKTVTLVLENNNASSGIKYGIFNSLVANSNNVTSSSIYNSISGNANFKSGINNVFSTNNTGTNIIETGVSNSFNFNGNVSAVGYSNFFNPISTNSGDIIGFQNSVSDGITGYFIGLQNTNDINTNNTKTGLLNSFGGAGSGEVVGIKNELLSTTTGEQIGIDTNISSPGTGLKYGEKIEIDNTSGGIHFGVYADVTKANSYAGYFLGRVAVGNTITNTYILPPSRGTNGQIMVTNGTGDVSWANPGIVFTDTDDQQIDVLSLTGNTLNLSLQNDGVATQTVDLSTLANDWKLTGNAGTASGTNFIGTTDAQDLSFRTNNITKLTLTQRGQLSITNTGGSVLVGSGAGDADDFTLNQNTFIGTVSGESTSSGNLNSALGFNSLNTNTLGLGNTAVGANALNVNVDGNNNTGLGRGANVSTTNLTNATAVGFNSTVNAANKIRLGNAAITVVEGQVAYTNPSDARFKFNVQENVPGLDFIKKLKPVTYNFDTKKFDEHLNQNRNKDEVTTEDFATSTAIIRTGFLAQDVEKICTDLGYNFDGLHVPDTSNPTDNYGIAYSQFIMPIVKAVQEQQIIIETQKTELEQLKSELEKYIMLEERIKALEQK